MTILEQVGCDRLSAISADLFWFFDSLPRSAESRRSVHQLATIIELAFALGEQQSSSVKAFVNKSILPLLSDEKFSTHGT